MTPEQDDRKWLDTLYRAIEGGHLNVAKGILDKYPEAVRRAIQRDIEDRRERIARKMQP